MREALRRNLTTIVVAFTVASVAASGTAIAIVANADKVDGYHANQLIRLSRKAVEGDAFTGGGSGVVLQTKIKAPKRGLLFMMASSDVFNLTNADRFQCLISVNGTDLSASFREIQLSPADNNEEMNCDTEIAWPVAAGTYTVAFETTGTDTQTVYDETTIEALYVPFNGTGAVPSSVPFSRVIRGLSGNR